MVWERVSGVCLVLGGALLAVLALIDFRKKAIPVVPPLAAGLLFGLLRIPSLPADTLAGAFMGAVIYILSRLRLGWIGSGDGIVVLCIGLLLGVTDGMRVLMLGLGGIFLFSCLGVIFGKMTRYTKIPFIPFYFLGYLGVMLL